MQSCVIPSVLQPKEWKEEEEEEKKLENGGRGTRRH
jgi:hypothetical protein